jgi:hypothetical protein
MKTPGNNKGILFLLALCVFVAGCMPILGGEKYYSELERNTRTYKLYDEIESVLIINATFKDRRFLEAFMAEYGRRYGIDDATRDAMLARELGEAEEYNEFFVSAATQVTEWNDFDGKNSIWRLYLVDANGGRTAPLSIERVERGDAFHEEFFPYLDKWSVGYIVKFPRYTEDGVGPFPNSTEENFALVATGVKGMVELRWGGKPSRTDMAQEERKNRL